MKLTRHFYLSEFTKSQTASRRGISNNPGPREVDNLRALCENVLEPVRTSWRKPVVISSGYRSPALNTAIGGSKTSQHCYGMAADIEIMGVDNCDLTRWIQDHLEYDQLILEFHNHKDGPNSGWIHVSYSAGRNRMQNITASIINGKTRYSKGFPWDR